MGGHHQIILEFASVFCFANKAIVGMMCICSSRSSDLDKKSDIVLFVQSSPPESNTVQEAGFDDRRVDPAHDPWAKTPKVPDRSATAVSSTCCLLSPNSQYRPPDELGIKNQAQIFYLGAQYESGSAYAKTGKGRNFISSIDKNRIGLRGVN